MQQPTPPTDIQALEEIMQAEEASLSEDQKRFLLDLEFVQALANPGYLRCTSHDLVLSLVSFARIKSHLNGMNLSPLQSWRQTSTDTLRMPIF